MIEEVTRLVDELRALGAAVVMGSTATAKAIAAAESKLKLALPAEYREFLEQIGGIRVELERTWLFYGLADALAKTEEYRAEFDRFRETGAYLPRRFVVLMDEGDYSNCAAGTVYDADLDAMIDTNGGRYLEEGYAYRVGYWGVLLDALSDVRDRIADTEDILVAGSERHKEQECAKRRAHPSPDSSGDAALAEAVECLYAAFSSYQRQRRARYCWVGSSCEACNPYLAALNDTPLRELTSTALQHYAYSALPGMTGPGAEASLQADYKHFVPRIQELSEEIGLRGNPEVVIGQLCKYLGQLTLTDDEAKAVDTYFDGRWRSLLLSPATEPQQLVSRLKAFAGAGRPLTSFLATWTSLLSDSTARQHLTRVAAAHEHDKDARYYGWQDAPFAEFREYLVAFDG